jgi:hypothetical protein
MYAVDCNSNLGDIGMADSLPTFKPRSSQTIGQPCLWRVTDLTFPYSVLIMFSVSDIGISDYLKIILACSVQFQSLKKVTILT